MLKYVAPLQQQLRHLSRRVPKRGQPLVVSTGDQESLGQRMAEHVAAGIGSWRFIEIQAFLMAIWILLNVLQLTQAIHFDPFPFVFLNLTMSAEAAFTGPILLVAANIGSIRDHKQYDRMEELERRIETNDEHLDAQLGALASRLDEVLMNVREPLPIPVPKQRPVSAAKKVRANHA